MPPQSPLENRPKGPRRVIQKIWADKDLRDSIIEQLEEQLDGSPAWSAQIRIDARESGTAKVQVKAHTEGTHR